ncbi:metallophosphoesterase family protein [Verrucomicrobiota bacterium]
MQYAIISDVHANLQAWNAVLLDIRSLDLDIIISLGDIVGYGPNPGEVLQSMHTNVNYFALGNHDAVICGKMNDSLFNDSAREIIQWTRKNLNKNAIYFLKTIPLSLNAGAFRCTHGDFSNPAAFNYIIDPEDALASWQKVDEQLLFVGHTHESAIFILGQSGTPRMINTQDFVLEPEKRFLVNVGSVGQPRDGMALAGYCIYDTDNNSVCWRRVPFDIDAYKDALNNAGVSAKPSYFLNHDPRQEQPPLRNTLNFRPAATPDEAVKDTIEVQELQTLKSKITKWKLLFAAAVILTLTIGGTVTMTWLRHSQQIMRIPGIVTPMKNAGGVPVDNNILSMPELTTPAMSPIAGWTVILGDKRKQNVKVNLLEDLKPLFILSSDATKNDLRLYSHDIIVRPGMKLCLEGMFKKDKDFTGNIAIVISLNKKDSTGKEYVDKYVVKEPNVQRKDGWLSAKETFILPANSHSIRYNIRGNFTGKVLIKDLSLRKKG